MSVRQPFLSRARTTRTSVTRKTAVTAAMVALSAGFAGCTSSGAEGFPAQSEDSPSPSAPPVSKASIESNVGDGAKDVRVDDTVVFTAEDGTFKNLEVTIGKSRKNLEGAFSRNKTEWTSEQRLEPGIRYNVTASAVDSKGLPAEADTFFRTDDLSLDEQTYPSLAPLPGETVGVGMPVIVQFDVPVTDRASIEKHLSVETSPKQKGAWSWLSDNEVHWRPKHFWKPGTEVTVDADINSVSAGDGVFGQESRSESFTIGDAMVSKVNVARHEMTVYRNGSLLRTIPITAGKDGFTTRSGTKVIIEKFREKKMDSETIGIDRNDPEYYRIDDVEYAMRVTYSGEFLHAAPWSVGSQGSENVSHGCVGMSPSDAAWLYDLTLRGDVVKFTGTDRSMEPGNGYTDWNKTFAEYKSGSALAS